MTSKRFVVSDYLLPLLILATIPLFFFKLGQGSLSNWDEAWYAEISRNIFKYHNVLDLVWNGKPYMDHPPFGFWLMGISMKLFGSTTFAVRLPSAMAGIMSLIVIYLLGRELFNNWVGFFSALALSSSSWFLLRSRSGNLDTLLSLMFLLTIYCAVKLVKNRKYLIPFFVSLALLFLTKTLVPFTIIPVLILIFYRRDVFFKKDIYLFVIISFIPIAIWIFSQLQVNPGFVARYLSIGYPGVSIKSSFISNILLTKTYLHNGIGRWFWYGIVSLFLGALLLQRRFYLMIVFAGIFLLPFFLSFKGQIWHLIPVHPFLILSFFGLLFVVTFRLFRNNLISIVILAVVFIYISYPQFRQNWYQIIDIPQYVSDEEILSREAGRFSEPYMIDDYFSPTAVYYSGKNVEQISEDYMVEVFKSRKPFVLFTNQWRLDKVGISKNKYEIIKRDRDKILVRSL